MSTPRLYLSRVDEGGRLVVLRSDGLPISDDERTWFNETVTRQLRTDLAMANKGQREGAVLYEEPALTGINPKTGGENRIHPLLNKMREIIIRQGFRFSALSELLGHRPSLVSAWLRGENTPRFADVVAIFGMLGYKFIPVPNEIAGEVENMIAQAESIQDDDIDQHKME